MLAKRYVRHRIDYTKINEIIKRQNIKNINFFVDFQSIHIGLYNKNNIFYELQVYMENNVPSETLIDEYTEFANNLYLSYKNYNPKIITFYDDGVNTQNSLLNTSYKSGRSSVKDIISDDEMINAYYMLKKLNFTKIETRFTIPGYGKVYYLRDYESDLIPHYVIFNNIYNSQDPSCLNIILSNDKDLLQTCAFGNVIQHTNRYLGQKYKNRKLVVDLFDDYNALSYIYQKFQPGILTSKYIPIILSVAGDTSDKIDGLDGVGNATAIKMFQNKKLPATPWELKTCERTPRILLDHIDIIEKNYKMIDFNEQLKRIIIRESEV